MVFEMWHHVMWYLDVAEIWELGLFPSWGEKETAIVSGPLERANQPSDLCQLVLKDQIEQVFLFHLKAEADPVSETLCFLVFHTIIHWIKSINPIILSNTMLRSFYNILKNWNTHFGWFSNSLPIVLHTSK